MTTQLRALPSGVATIQDEWPEGWSQRVEPIRPSPTVELQTQELAPRPDLVSVRIQSLFFGLRMLEPVTVEVEREDAFYIAKWNAISEFGYGHDPFEAVDDLRVTVAELYRELKAASQKGQLGEDLSTIWQRLSAIIQEA